MAKKRISKHSVAAIEQRILILEQEEERSRLVHEILPYCELSRIRLRSCTSESAEDIYHLTAPFSMNISDSSARSLGVWDDELVTEIHVIAEGSDSSTENKNLFRFACIFHVHYRLEEGFKPSHQQATAFAEDYGVFNSWPFIRELFQTMMHKMDLSPPDIPFLRRAGGPARPLSKSKVVKGRSAPRATDTD